jgi:aminoglycoside phosphotransferase (APT) family kinase protein
VIERSEVEAAARSAFPGQSVLGTHQLPKGFDFEVYRVDLEETGPVVFRGQRDFASSHQCPLDFGRILLGEVRFYERLSHLPVPRTLHFEPDPTKLGFSYAFFTYLPGRPISDLLVDASQQARDGVFFEAGRLLGLVHSEPVEHVGPLSDESRESWGAYMGPRLRRRLAPHQGRGLLDSAETELLVGRASRLPLATPRLLHMDFRPVNLLGEAVGESIEITGVVDAANCLAGDPAFDLARLEEGEGLDGRFLAGYEQVAGAVDRDTDAYGLYRLETAALLADVYENSPEGGPRQRRLFELKNALVESLR